MLPKPDVPQQNEENTQCIKMLAIAEKYTTTITNWSEQFYQGNIKDTLNNQIFEPNQAIASALSAISSETLDRYYGHGITRSTADHYQISALAEILHSNKLFGYEGPLEQSQASQGNISAYKHGNFLLISKPDKHLIIRDTSDGESSKVKIGAILLNGLLTPLVGEFQKIFPEHTFLTSVKHNQYPDLYIEEWMRSH